MSTIISENYTKTALRLHILALKSHEIYMTIKLFIADFSVFLYNKLVKNVVVRNDFGEIVMRFPKLQAPKSQWQNLLKKAGLPPGRYKFSRNVKKAKEVTGEGKKSKKILVSRPENYYVNLEGGQVLAPGQSPVIVYGQNNPQDPAQIMAGMSEKFGLVLDKHLAPVLDRIQKIEEEIEEEEEPEEDSTLIKVMTVLSKPNYVLLLQAIMSGAPSEQMVAQIQNAFSQNPNLLHNLVADLINAFKES